MKKHFLRQHLRGGFLGALWFILAFVEFGFEIAVLAGLIGYGCFCLGVTSEMTIGGQDE